MTTVAVKEDGADGTPNQTLYAAEVNPAFNELMVAAGLVTNLDQGDNEGLAKGIVAFSNNLVYVDEGISNHVVLQSHLTIKNSLQAYIHGASYMFKPKATNSGPADMLVGVLSAKPLLLDNAPLAPNLLNPSKFYLVRYVNDGTRDNFELLGALNSVEDGFSAVGIITDNFTVTTESALMINTGTKPIEVELPVPKSGREIVVKDFKGTCNINPITIRAVGNATIDAQGVGVDFVLATAKGSVRLLCIETDAGIFDWAKV